MLFVSKAMTKPKQRNILFSGSIASSPLLITETVHSANHCFIIRWWLKLVYSTVQRRSCIVCSGSSNQHPGDSLPWVTPVSDTLSAAYMPPTPPLLHSSLCSFSLFLHCTIYPLASSSLSGFFLSFSTPCISLWLSCPLSLFLSVSTLPLLPPVIWFQLALFKTLHLLCSLLPSLLLIQAFPSYSPSHD